MLKNNSKANDALIMLCYTCAFGAFGAFFRWLQMQVARDTETGMINPSILNILLPLFGGVPPPLCCGCGQGSSQTIRPCSRPG